MNECRSCGHPVDWAYSLPDEQGVEKTNPINHDSADDPKGNLAVWRDPDGVLRYRYLRKGDEPQRGEHRGISHFATCKQSATWRKPKAAQS